MTATLRTLITLPRVLRHGAAVGAQLPPDASVVLDPPTPELRAALTAAYAGDHAPARDLLAATRLGAEWERRGGYVPRLAESALHSPGWLDAWLAESPRDPDAVLVKAEHGVRQAWEIRTGARASSVSRDQFQAFFALLDDAVPVIGAAAELNPTDPVPWQVALTHARGSQAPREVFDAYWAEATARAPHHYGCHVSAMQYLCDKWYGSHAEMFDFAERAAQEALPGSKLHALPLLAAVEYDVVADGGNGGAGIERSRIHAALKRAQELSDAYPQGDPEVAGVRNHLALMLVLAGRHGEALEQFRAVGSHATQYPWAYLGDARGEFLDFRTGVRMRVAARVPFFSRPKPPQFPKLPAAPAPSHPGTPRFLALVAAPPHTVADAALMCGVPLRIAPAPDRSSYVELAADPEPGIRATLLGEDRLTAAADNITTGEPWPALVLRRSGDRSGFTLLQQGKKVADHDWDPAAPVPTTPPSRPPPRPWRGCTASPTPARSPICCAAPTTRPAASPPWSTRSDCRRSRPASAAATRSSPPSRVPGCWPAGASSRASWTPCPATVPAAPRLLAGRAGGCCASRRCRCSCWSRRTRGGRRTSAGSAPPCRRSRRATSRANWRARGGDGGAPPSGELALVVRAVPRGRGCALWAPRVIVPSVSSGS